jgi:dihydrofolate reductase
MAATFVFGMNQSLDGYVDYDKFAPGPELFRHFIKQTGELTGSVYGRKLYEIMAYWDEEQEGWSDDERAFAAAWRNNPKWVVSSTLKEVGPNATLVTGDLDAAMRKIKAEHDGTIEVGGGMLAQGLSDLRLIDEYCIYLHPVVIGSGDAFFRALPPPLRFVSSQEMPGGVLKLIYVPK